VSDELVPVPRASVPAQVRRFLGTLSVRQAGSVWIEQWLGGIARSIPSIVGFGTRFLLYKLLFGRLEGFCFIYPGAYLTHKPSSRNRSSSQAFVARVEAFLELPSELRDDWRHGEIVFSQFVHGALTEVRHTESRARQIYSFRGGLDFGRCHIGRDLRPVDRHLRPDHRIGRQKHWKRPICGPPDRGWRYEHGRRRR